MNNVLDNDIYYVCRMVEYTARKTKNRRGTVVEKLGLYGGVSRNRVLLPDYVQKLTAGDQIFPAIGKFFFQSSSRSLSNTTRYIILLFAFQSIILRDAHILLDHGDSYTCCLQAQIQAKIIIA